MQTAAKEKLLFKGKKVLLVGLGRLGGGLAMAKFFIAQGARLTITDLKTADELKDSIRKLNRSTVTFVLGKHRKEDFLNNEIIVCNPATPISSSWVQLAMRAKKRVENDLSLFLELLRVQGGEYVAVTGTRGKTTTTHWLHHFVGGVMGGNQPHRGFLDIIKKKTPLFVVEVPSYQLEFMRPGYTAPKVAIITNLYIDHINRHGTFQVYGETKARLFLNQTQNDFLVLNADDKHTRLFLAQKPKSAVFFTSLHALPKTRNGLFFVGDTIYFQRNGKGEYVTTVMGMSEHEKRNLLAAMLGSYLYGVSWDRMVAKIATLPSVALREEVILKKKNFMVINDSAATSPEATIAALEKFGSSKGLVLITGGTDKQLIFKDLARKIKEIIPEKQLYILEGSATTKLLIELQKLKYFKKEPRVYNTLSSLVMSISPISVGTILFSPGAASFEKFKNEFDRGKKFAALTKRYFV